MTAVAPVATSSALTTHRGQLPSYTKTVQRLAVITPPAFRGTRITLTATDISGLKAFLDNPTSSPTPTPTPNADADANANERKAVYDSSCAGCHRMGTYDTSGSAPDLYQSTRIDSYYTAGVSGHKGVTLSATDISNLKTFVGTSSPRQHQRQRHANATPTTGKAVYDSDCASCHRLGTYDTSGSAPNLSGDGSGVSEIPCRSERAQGSPLPPRR
jgi:mono/diheme cytochrome c family protein